MKRHKSVLLIIAFLIIYSYTIFGQTISPISFNQYCTAGGNPYATWDIDIQEAKGVRFTYTTDMLLSQHVVAFYEQNADGLNYNLIGSASGYKSGTVCTNLKRGKARILFFCFNSGAAKFNIQFAPDNSIVTNSDLNVGGNVKLGPVGGGVSTILGSVNNSGAIQIKSNFSVGGSAYRYLRLGWNDNSSVFTPVLSINEDLNVGIGTTNPNQKLTIKGKIYAEEIIVELAVPADYVFKPDYKLMPLQEVERYVTEQNHLPEMPSASHIIQNGLNVGEMQNKLLQKIEELTLYVIKQQKEIQTLNTEIQTMKST